MDFDASTSRCHPHCGHGGHELGYLRQKRGVLGCISRQFPNLDRVRLWPVVARGKSDGGSCSSGWPWSCGPSHGFGRLSGWSEPWALSRSRTHARRRPEWLTAWRCLGECVWPWVCRVASCDGYVSGTLAPSAKPHSWPSGTWYRPKPPSSCLSRPEPRSVHARRSEPHSCQSPPRIKRHLRSMDTWFLYPKCGTEISTRPVSSSPSLVVLAFEYLTVQRASVSFCAALDRSSGQMSDAASPALARAFSSFVIRWRGAETNVASTI